MEHQPHTEAASDHAVASAELLTSRERHIASLVARGQTNRQIAQALVISERTADGHVANILAKLNVRSRAEIAVWVVEHRPTQAPSAMGNGLDARSIDGRRWQVSCGPTCQRS